MNSNNSNPGDLNPFKQTEEVYKEIDFKKEGLSLLTCPRCNHIVGGEDIDAEHTKAKCSSCGYEFEFAFDSEGSALVPELRIPEGIEELKLRSELDLRLRWKETTTKGGRWFMILFTSIWNLVLLPFVVGVIVSGQWGIFLFLALHLLIGLGLLWNLATIYLNSTSISVTRERIKIRTVPFRHPIWRGRDIDALAIEQLYVSKYVQSSTNGVPNYAFALYAILKTGEKVSLIRGMSLETQTYIEKAIEDYLGIRNFAVPEEAQH
ncbi:MAG: IBR domain-containing protein [Saprospiraceae bacterium]